MKLLPLLLASALLVPSASFANGNNNGNGCRNRCGDTVTNNTSNTTSNQGGQGGTGHGYGVGHGGSVNNSGNSFSSSNSSTSSNSANRSSQSISIQGDQREVPVAPLLENDSVGRVGDIAVPIPVISVTGFASSRHDNTADYGATFGIRVPLGTGLFRDAAEEERQRRVDRGNFRLIQEAVWLREKGLLNRDAHPRHYAALYGNK